MKNLIILTSLLMPVTTMAALIPTKETTDSRVTVIPYSPDNVIRIRTAKGVNTLIQFEKGESFSGANSGLGIGDIEAWGISAKGNNVFLKPKAESPNTNLNVVSSKGRTYSFDLVTSKYPYYIVKMQYEKPKTSKDFAPAMPCNDGELNFRYGKWGDNELAPTYMWDDGRFTCLKFDKHGELPVIYQVATNGTESLVNYSLKKDTMVVHSVSKEFRLRLGKQVLGLRSENTLSSGYNDKATSIDAKRELNHD